MGVLAEVGWISLYDGSTERFVAAAAISVIAIVCGLIFYAYTYRKWGPFLSNLKLDLHIIQEESSHGKMQDGFGGSRDEEGEDDRV